MGRANFRPDPALAALVTSTLVLLPSTALAQVSPGDASATRVYLQADYAAARAELSAFPTAVAAVEDLAAQVRSECSGVLAGAPPNPTAADLAEEQFDAVFGAAANTESARRRRFASFVARLRWSNAALTGAVHELADGEAEMAATPPPSLCADIRSWVASGYQIIPAATTSYLRLESAISAKTEGKEAAIERKLAPYESPADQRIARKLAQLEKSQLPALLKKLLAAASKVREALVTPAPGG